MGGAAGGWLKTRAVSFWIWLLLAVALLCTALFIASLLWQQRQTVQESALEQGRHIAIDLATGNVEGNLRQLNNPEKKEPPKALPKQEPTAKTAPLNPSPTGAGQQVGGVKATEHHSALTQEKAKGKIAGVAAVAEKKTPEIPVSDAKQSSESVKTASAEVKEVTKGVGAVPASSTAIASGKGTVGVARKATGTSDAVEALMERPRVSLKPSPNMRLVEKKDGSYLPKTGLEGETSWQFYGRPHRLAANKKPVAILIPNLGLSKKSTEAALELPGEFSLIFSPYARDASKWTRKAREMGHEVLLALAQEEEDYPASDPGPYGLLTELPPEDNLERLYWQLSRFTGYVGVYSPKQDKFTRSPAGNTMLKDLSERGIVFIYGNYLDNAEYGEVVRGGVSIPGMKVDLVVDKTPTADSIREALESLEKRAEEKGFALGLAHAYPVTLEALKVWAAGLDEGDAVSLAPLTSVIQATIADE